ncbi:MAG TPA: sugar ABC transporter permease [Spirochaetia bacterium]|nr:sugar ABC transporter permease [Spirochaetia bacterium]
MKKIARRFLHDLSHPILRWGYIFVIPGLLSYLLFTFYPTVRCFLQSLHLIRGANNPWVYKGLGGYWEIFQEKIFWDSLWNTFYYVLLTVPAGTVLSLLIAVVLNSIGRLRGFFRALYFIPSVAGVIAMGIVFNWMYEPYSGVLNLILSKLGLPQFNWLRDMNMALPSIAVMTIWRTLGYNIVIFLAGLLAIPLDYYEAASMDGVNPVQKLFKITIPLIAPSMWFVIINNTIRDLQVFSEVFIMTGGGPGHATTTVGYRVYQYAFLYLSFGKASANALVLLVIILVITILQFRVFEERTKVSF